MPDRTAETEAAFDAYVDALIGVMATPNELSP